MENLIIFTAIFQTISIAISFIIGIITYKAYKDTGSQKMGLLTLGFFIIGIGTIVEGVLYEVVNMGIIQAHFAESVVMLTAFLIIYYALIIKKEEVKL